VRSVSLR